MNSEGMSKKLVDFITNLSNQFGSGVVLNDVIVFTVVVAVFALLLALVAWRKSATLKSPPGLERLAGVAGRVEKVEMNLNEFRTEAVRNIEIFKGEFGFLKSELAEIRKALSQIQEGSGGDQGGSSGDIGGGAGGGFDGPTKLPSGSNFSAAPYPLNDPLNEVHAIEEEVHEVSELEVEVDVKPEPKPTLSNKLSKTRLGFFQKLKNVFLGKPKLAPEMIDELEALLVSSDVGIKMTTSLVSKLKKEIAENGRSFSEEEVYSLLKGEMNAILLDGKNNISLPEVIKNSVGYGRTPFVVMVVGVNGVGKTTTVAKLASQCKESGLKVMMAAADTFRAAAVNQLREWGDRIGVAVISGAENAKPATVVYDAAIAAKNEGADILIIDTAGRLHTKSNLMQELEGVRNAVGRHLPDAPHETLLVVDGSTGQNALSQAREFNLAVPLTGVIVTKLDGTPKGGIIVAIKEELGVPIRYIGVGESKDDLKQFNSNEFIEALFDNSTDIEVSETSAPVISSHGEVRRRRREGSELPML